MPRDQGGVVFITPVSYTHLDVYKRQAVGAYCKDIEAGKKFMENTFKLGDSGKVYDAVLVSPLANAKFEPDAVIIYSNPAQTMRLIHGCVYDNGEKVKADTVAEAAMCRCV